METVKADLDQSVTQPHGTVTEQCCQVSVASHTTNNAILHWADCVSRVFVWSQNVRLPTETVFMALPNFMIFNTVIFRHATIH